MKTTTKLKVHPAADVFPMLPDDELQELAADIKENGLREPIKVKDGVLIDGRNRLKACELAGVEPRFEELNGESPESYILSVNINRRHLTKGQRAMATAMVWPEGRQGKKATSLKNNEVSGGYVRMARTVLATMPELAKQVMAGIVSLNEAYATAQNQKQDNDRRSKGKDALREQAPDMADLVDEERMTLQEAFAALKAREEEKRARKAEFAKAGTLMFIAANNIEEVITEVGRLKGTLRDVVDSRASDQLPGDFERLTAAIDALKNYKAAMEKRLKEETK